MTVSARLLGKEVVRGRGTQWWGSLEVQTDSRTHDRVQGSAVNSASIQAGLRVQGTHPGVTDGRSVVSLGF